MWTFTLPLTLLATLVVSSAFAQPIDLVDDFSAIDFLSHPDDATVLYRYDNEEEEQRNDIVEADEPRHLEKRSPIPPFDPISKKLKLKAKKLALKLKPFKLPALKKLPKLAVPLGGAGLGAGALSRVPGGPGRFLPFLPSLPSFG